MNDIGKALKRIRGKETQSEFAERIGISRSYLGDLENNRKNPSVETLSKIANKLDISLNELLYGTSHEMINKANTYYNELVKTSSEKHIFEVATELKDTLILEAINNFENSVFISDKHLKTTIYWRFKQHYYENVKSNESLINLYIERLTALEEELNDYFTKSVLLQLSDQLMLFIEIRTNDISESLFHTLRNKIIEIREEAYDLEKEFPNKKIKHNPAIQFIGPSVTDPKINRQIIENRYENDINNELIKNDISKALEKLINENNLDITKEDLFREYSSELEQFMQTKEEYLDNRK